MLIENEEVWTILEYAPNKLLVYVFNKDLLVIKNWKVIRRIQERDSRNIEKYQVSPLAGFDAEIFPFAAMSGRKSLNIVNVVTGSMQVLVQTPVMSKHGHSSFFFKVGEDGV